MSVVLLILSFIVGASAENYLTDGNYWPGVFLATWSVAALAGAVLLAYRRGGGL